MRQRGNLRRLPPWSAFALIFIASGTSAFMRCRTLMLRRLRRYDGLDRDETGIRPKSGRSHKSPAGSMRAPDRIMLSTGSLPGISRGHRLMTLSRLGKAFIHHPGFVMVGIPMSRKNPVSVMTIPLHLFPAQLFPRESYSIRPPP